MNDNISEVLIRTAVHRGISAMKESPKRTIRNLVDLALTFTDGRFQQQFFETAQQMLEDESSAYYHLVQNLAENTDEDRLLTFGMNIGYNGCTLGANRIRSIEAQEGYNIPWSVSLGIRMKDYSEKEDAYHALIGQGENLGIYCWLLFPTSEPEKCLSMVRSHPDSAFILMCPEQTNVGVLIDESCGVNNLMVAVRYNSMAGANCDMLTEARMLYSLYYPYDEHALEVVADGSLFHKMEQLKPAFSVLLPAKGCPESVERQVYIAIQEARMSQDYQTILWELFQDSLLVDSVISEEGCWAAFDENGCYHGIHTDGTVTFVPSAEMDLQEILRKASVFAK